MGFFNLKTILKHFFNHLKTIQLIEVIDFVFLINSRKLVFY